VQREGLQIAGKIGRAFLQHFAESLQGDVQDDEPRMKTPARAARDRRRTWRSYDRNVPRRSHGRVSACA
jgi:hypothetical protein